jgi:hypothetical protein
MIAKLKSECGYQWTNKLEGMFKVRAQKMRCVVSCWVVLF